MRTIYLDIFSGISGDLLLGALIDLGADLGRLQRELSKLELGGFHIHADRRQASGIEGVKFDVHLEEAHHPHPHPHGTGSGHTHPPSSGETHAHGRTYADIQHLISTSRLSDWVKQKSLRIFERLALAEGKIHGRPPDQVQFHEVGAIDSIVDIVGACVALELLEKPQLLAAAVVEGTGWIHCAHGRLPIPAPATLEILSARSIKITQCDEPNELVTPTGAALLAELVENFGPMRDFLPAKVGYGLGTRETKTRPNILRAVLGEAAAPGLLTPVAGSAKHYDWETDTVTTLQTDLDDLNSEILGRFIELAMAAGALDVFFTPIQMKKSRPGTLLTVLCEPAEADRLSELILRETSAFGVRRWTAERRKLRREVVVVKTSFGEVAVKLGRLNGHLVQVAPEFGSCRQVAEQARVPLKQVYEAAVRAADLA